MITAKNSETQRKPSNPKSLARYFSRLGWTGFWMQLGLLLVPILLLLYVLFIGSAESAQRKGINLSNYLPYGSLLVMLFTTFWCYRYTRLAKQIANSESCTPQSSVLKTLWIGLGASSLGIFFSMILMMIPAVLLALVQTDLTTTLLVALGYFLANTAIGSILEPRIMGRGLGISTLAVFLSLLFWGWVLGTVGVFLAVPLTMALIVALESSPQTRPLAILLGSEVTADPAPLEKKKEYKS